MRQRMAWKASGTERQFSPTVVLREGAGRLQRFVVPPSGVPP